MPTYGWLIVRAMLLGMLVLAAAVPAHAAQVVQPGMYVGFAGYDGNCTGNFVYDGLGPLAGRTYIGLASHCVGTLPDPMVLVDADGEPFGRVVHKTWPLETVRDDWALIEIFPERFGDVDPAQRGNPEYPTGVAGVQDVKVGDEVRISGWGTLMDADEDLQMRRTGYVTQWDGVYYDLFGAISPGDSGAALVHVATGRALGFVSAYCVPPNTPSVEHVAARCVAFGPTALEVMRAMADEGFPVRMRLAGEPAPAPPAAPASPQPPPASAPPATPDASRKMPARKKKAARCKTRKQKRTKRCRRARARRG